MDEQWKVSGKRSTRYQIRTLNVISWDADFFDVSKWNKGSIEDLLRALVVDSSLVTMKLSVIDSRR